MQCGYWTINQIICSDVQLLSHCYSDFFLATKFLCFFFSSCTDFLFLATLILLKDPCSVYYHQPILTLELLQAICILIGLLNLLIIDFTFIFLHWESCWLYVLFPWLPFICISPFVHLLLLFQGHSISLALWH